MKWKSILRPLGLLAILTCYGLTTQAQDYRTGQIFRDCHTCPELVVIPSGTFQIGSPETEPERTPFEGPQKTISIKKLGVGRFDVTRKQWAAFVKATHRPVETGCAFSGSVQKGKRAWDINSESSWDHLGFKQDGKHPVVCVNWKDVHDYLAWLEKLTGKKYRLLSESEWEYAARAGSTDAFPWGKKADHEHANYGADSGWTGLALGRDKWEFTSPVGSFAPNAFGLYDMHGNVLQFVQDYFFPNYENLPADGKPFLTDTVLQVSGQFHFMNGKKSAESRMVRGGDWGDPPRMVRSAFRNWAPGRGLTLETYRSGGLGFRVARDL